MKKLMGIVLALVMTLGLAAPALAVTTEATVGGDDATAYMIALFATPDEVGTTDGTINVKPEPAVPNDGTTLWPPSNEGADGWKRMKFYIIANRLQLGHDAITGVDITVNYPNGVEKFQLNALKDPTYGWEVQGYDSGYAAVSYPIAPGETPTAGVHPTWTVRELTYTDIVDMNANCSTSDSVDRQVPDALTALGARVVYGTDPENGDVAFNATTAAAKLQADKALMLELVGWIWYHQDPVWYTFEGSVMGPVQSAALVNTFEFVPTLSLYMDFDEVDYGEFESDGSTVIKQGDNDLSTSGLPTIWCNGNINAQVLISSTKLVLDGDDPVEYAKNYSNPAKTIDSFDVTLTWKDANFNPVISGSIDYDADTGSHLITYLNTPVEKPVLLQACRPAQIDFSLHPRSGIYNGDYYGTMTITLQVFGYEQPGACYPPEYDGGTPFPDLPTCGGG